MKSADIDAVAAREQVVADGTRRVRIRLQAAAEADRRQRAAARTQEDGGSLDCAVAPELAIGTAAPPVPDIIGAAGAIANAGFGGWLHDDAGEPVDHAIAGVGDRAHHMALKVSHVVVAPRQAPVGRPQPLPRLRPSSRADCQRRCGTAGFCDPSSDLGCGGEYCASRYEPL
jgi:hypothetical protein